MSLRKVLSGKSCGAGNCPTELLLSFLKNPKFKVRPLVEAIESQILPWQEKIGWGYYVPYMLTGVLNQHPRTAMAHMESKNKNKIVEFFDSVTSAVDME